MERPRTQTRAMALIYIDDDIVQLSVAPGWDEMETAEIANENISAFIDLIEGQKVAVLVIMPNHHLLPEARKAYRDRSVAMHCIALVAPSSLKKLIASLLISTFGSRAPAPTKVFKSKRDALDWIHSKFLADNSNAA
jgi:hypothetical protein